MIDARGLSCPQPVLMAKKEIDAKNPKTLEICVDNATAVGNLRRLAGHLGYEVSVKEQEDDEYLVKFVK